MYKDVPGAVFDGKSRYTLPCNSVVDVSVAIGYAPFSRIQRLVAHRFDRRNRTFPINPIDTVILADPGENTRTDASPFICIGAFSYLQAGASDVGK